MKKDKKSRRLEDKILEILIILAQEKLTKALEIVQQEKEGLEAEIRLAVLLTEAAEILRQTDGESIQEAVAAYKKAREDS